MDYRIKANGNDKEIEINGTFTFRDHDKFFEIISEIEKQQGGKIAFNMAGCDFIDSAALGMLVIASDEASVRHISLAIKNANGKVKDLMMIARFETLYDIE
ncbi:MAG: STAS domain-containing protein [Alphaproteobacteria bacterium]|nr:STAS domain-containing protein [Alphaproteobacteria bacterium]